MKKAWSYLKKKWVTLVIIFLSAFYFASNFSYFSNWSWPFYPFFHQDAWIRLQDALFYLKQISEPVLAPPVTSLTYALILKINPSLFFIFNSVVFISTFLLSFLVAKEVSRNKIIGLLTSLFFFFGFYNIHYSNFIGLIDIFSLCFMLLSTHLFLRYMKAGKLIFLLLSATAIALAGLTQYVGIFMLPILLAYFLYREKINKVVRDKKQLLDLSLFVGITIVLWLSFFFYRQLQYGSFTYSKVEHFELARLHFDQIKYYFVTSFIYFSPPVVILTIWGIIQFLYQQKYRILVFSGIMAGPFLAFFTFYYTWKDIRFLIYMLFPVYILAAYGLYYLSRSITKKAGITLLILTSLILLYSNLHNQGHWAIPIGPKTGLSLVNRSFVDSQIEIKQIKMPQIYQPYFTYMFNFTNNIEQNPEFGYYIHRVTPKTPLSIIDQLPEESFSETAIFLAEETWVRYQQLVFFGRYNFPFNHGSAIDYQYLIVDQTWFDQNQRKVSKTFKTLVKIQDLVLLEKSK